MRNSRALRRQKFHEPRRAHIGLKSFGNLDLPDGGSSHVIFLIYCMPHRGHFPTIDLVEGGCAQTIHCRKLGRDGQFRSNCFLPRHGKDGDEACQKRFFQRLRSVATFGGKLVRACFGGYPFIAGAAKPYSGTFSGRLNCSPVEASSVRRIRNCCSLSISRRRAAYSIGFCKRPVSKACAASNSRNGTRTLQQLLR